MAFKKTVKRTQALRALKDITGKDHSRKDSQTLYDTLEAQSYHWDSSDALWKNTPPPSTSMFKDDEGNPSGVLRVRLMGMEPDAEAFLKAVTVKGWTLIDKSSAYPNRKGPGWRWYLTYKRD